MNMIRTLVSGSTLAVAGFLAATNPAAAVVPETTVASFAGTWQMTVIGQTGCGFGTQLYEVTIPASGAGTATGISHTAGCGDSVISTPVDFTIESVAADGSGTAGLTCGSGCGWALMIQLAPSHQIFNLIDVDSANPGNFIEGSAVRQ